MADIHHLHPHDHDHDEGPPTYYQAMEIAVRELLIEKGIITAADVRRAVEAMDARTPAQGARVVARAWTNPAFKARLLADGSAAVRELGIDVGITRLVVLENTPALHNLVVCTLCSCYPRMVLGRPPDWYKSRAYRSRAVREPRDVLKEFGTIVGDHVEVRVHDFDRRHALSGAARAAGRDREMERGAACRARHPRQHDRRRALPRVMPPASIRSR